MNGSDASIHVAPLSALQDVAAALRPEAVISLMSTAEPVPTPLGVDPARHARLVFNDIAEVPPSSQGLVPPSEAHVATIIEAARAWSRTRPLLVHCWFGVSRSPAAAAIMVAALEPDRPSEDIARTLRAAAPFATPNPRMIALGDALLDRGGTLVAAVERIGRGAECSEGVPFALAAGARAA